MQMLPEQEDSFKFQENKVNSVHIGMSVCIQTKYQ
jgi:hypothetical protein